MQEALLLKTLRPTGRFANSLSAGSNATIEEAACPPGQLQLAANTPNGWLRRRGVSLYYFYWREIRVVPYSRKMELTMGGRMRTFIACVVVVLFLSGVAARAKDEPVYDKGTLLKMESQPCGTDEKGGKSLAGEVIGTDSENKKTNQVLCPEYVLQTDRVIYKIRPRDEKHPTLLPIGEKAEFRIDHDKMKLRVPEMNLKEEEYTVVSMSLRSDATDARAQGQQ